MTTRHPYRFSLRARATTWYVGLLAVALIFFSVAVYMGVRTYLKQSLERALSSTAHALVDDFLTRLPQKGDSWVLGEVRESYDTIPTDRYVRLSVDGRVLFITGDMRSPSIPLDQIALPASSAHGAVLSHDLYGRMLMIYDLPFRASDGRVFQVETGSSLASMQQTLRSLEKILLLATSFTLLLAGIGGYFLMKQPLRPLVVLTEKAANIGTKGLGERLPVTRTGDELERLTHSLNAMIDRLEEALDHNYRFSADASHELRTPLTIMRGEMEEMLSIPNLPTEALENLVSTLEEIDRMSRIVSSLMAITRLDGGGERMDLQVIDLSGLVRTTIEQMRLLAEEKQISLTCVCAERVLVQVDPMRIRQVLVNLIDNAIKYTPSAAGPNEDELNPEGLGRRPGSDQSVQVVVSASDVNAVLTVSDHGVGIAPEVLPFVFDRFYRADFARSRVAGGVGLGLAIVKAIVAAHSGSVAITSAVRQGSVVVVHLPLANIGARHDREAFTAAAAKAIGAFS